MQKQSKKKESDNLDLGLDEDLEIDPLDMSDIGDDERLLSLDFQDIKELETGKEKDTDGEDIRSRSTNLLDYAKDLLKKVQDKPIHESSDDNEKKTSVKKKELDVTSKANSKFEARFHVIELMIEELENFGLDIKVIQDIIKESEKFYKSGDIEAAETLIKNSKIFASNLWLEHRMNLISTLISFIDTFILNQTELDLDFKNANKYFAKAQEFLAERDLTLANKYIDNTIQKVKKGWNTARKIQQREAIKHARYWIKELEELNLDLTEFEEIINSAEKTHNKSDFDQTELFLKRLIDSSGEEIKNINIDVNQKEDFIQGIQGVYDIENFSILNEAISKAESMLSESQEKDRIQFQLNQLLSSYKIVLEMKNRGLEVTKLNEMFSHAKESFEKGDYDTSGVFVKKILGFSKQMLGSNKGEIDNIDQKESEEDKDNEKPTEKSKQKAKVKTKGIDKEKLSPELRKVYDELKLLKSEINFIKSKEKTGEDIVRMDELFSNAKTALKDESTEDAEKYLIELQKIVLKLKDNVLKTEAENTMESVFTICSEARELGIDVDEVENIFKSAEEHLKRNEYQEAIDKALKSQGMIELVMEKHQNASDRLLKTKMSLKKAFKDEKKPKEFDGIFKQAKFALRANDYDAINVVTNFILDQVKIVKAGKELDLNLIIDFEKAITFLNTFQSTLDELPGSDVKTAEAQELYNNARNAFKEQKFNEVSKIIENIEKIIGKSGKSEELRKLRSDLNIVVEGLKIIENNGFEVSDQKAMIEELKILIESGEIPQAEELVKEIKNDIANMKNQNKEFEERINTAINDLVEDIAQAKSEKVDTKKAEDLLNYAKQRLKTKNFSEVKGILDQSNELLEKAIQAKFVSKVEDRLNEAVQKLETLPNDNPRFNDLNGLTELASEKFQINDLQASMDYLEQFFTHFSEIEMLEKPEDEEIEVVSEDETIGEVAEEGERLVAEEEETSIIAETELEEIEPEEREPEIATEEMELEVETRDKVFDQNLAEDSEVGQEIGIEQIYDAETAPEAPGMHDEGEVNGLEDELEVPVKEDETTLVPGETEMEPELLEKQMELSEDITQEAPETKEPPDEQLEGEVKDEEKLKRPERYGFDSHKAEALFKEAFGFMEKDRRGIYGKEQSSGPEGTAGDSTRGYDTEQVTQTRQKPIRDKALAEVRKDRARGRIPPRGPPSSPPARHERAPQHKYEHEIEARKYSQRRGQTYPLAPEPGIDDYSETKEDEGSPGFDEKMDEEYLPYDLENGSATDDEDYIPPPVARRRIQRAQGRPLRRQFSETQKLGRFGEYYDKGVDRRKRIMDDRKIEEEMAFEPSPLGEAESRKTGIRQKMHEKRLESLKKEALKGLQDIQAIITNTYNFGAPIQELEQLSEDALNAFDSGDYQDVLLYVDQTEEVSIRLKIAYMDSLVAEIQHSGENTNYLEHLINEAENAYNDERFKVGDELCRKFMMVVKELELEARSPKHSKIYCRYCGNSLPADSTFCAVCGEKLW